MALVDTHCHLQHDAFDADRDDVLSRALDALDWIVVIGDNLATSLRAAAELRDRVYATVGIHPHHAEQADADTLTALRDLAANPGVVAVGEIGLDYHYNFAPRDRQVEAFRAQLDLACDLRLPVVVHCREAEADIAAAIEPVCGRLAGGIMHCFSGNAAFAARCLSWGFYLSFAGNVTFPKAHAIREAAAIVPLDRMLVETDSPYLAPQPVRGKRCEPIHVLHTAAFLAHLRGVPLEHFAEQTTRDARTAFCVG